MKIKYQTFTSAEDVEKLCNEKKFGFNEIISITFNSEMLLYDVFYFEGDGSLW